LAAGFFKTLDDDLHARGAQFDIVDTVKASEIQTIGLTETLLSMIHD
jgi:hypothetical protein